MSNPLARKILACVDQSHFADVVAQHAIWAAQRLAAPLEFLHVIDREPELGTGEDHSGAIGIDAREELLATLGERDRARAQTAREQGRRFLDRLRQLALAGGIHEPDVRQRHGSLDETLAEQESQVQLFVFGRRGASAALTQRDLGRNVERMVRALHMPILAVTDEYRTCRRVLVAFDGGSTTRRAVQFVADSNLFTGLPVHVLTAGATNARHEKALAWAAATLGAAGLTATTACLAGDPETVIARAVAEHQIDLLVMGAYTHSRLRSLVMGSKTNNLLRSAKVATLLVR